MRAYYAIWSLSKGILPDFCRMDAATERFMAAQDAMWEKGVQSERDPPMTTRQAWYEELHRRSARIPKGERVGYVRM